MNKLKKPAGESLAEALISILIAALATVALASSILASKQILESEDKTDEAGLATISIGEITVLEAEDEDD